MSAWMRRAVACESSINQRWCQATWLQNVILWPGLGFDIPCKPEGAFYIYANASRFTDDSQAFCLSLLEEHGVAVTPGLDFGRHRAGEHLRFSYTTGMDRLELAVERLARVLS